MVYGVETTHRDMQGHPIAVSLAADSNLGVAAFHIRNQAHSNKALDHVCGAKRGVAMMQHDAFPSRMPPRLQAR